MITKAGVAIVLGIETADISDSVYDWAVKQFFLVTGLKSAEETKTQRRFVNRATLYFKLNARDIKSIDTLKIDNDEKDFTLFSDLKFNPDSGLVYYTGGFSGGQLVEMTYTVNSYTEKDIHDYLVSLLVAKSMSMFTPDKIQQVSSIKIGKFSKKFGSAASNLESYNEVLESEIQRTVYLINDNDTDLDLGHII